MGKSQSKETASVASTATTARAEAAEEATETPLTGQSRWSLFTGLQQTTSVSPAVEATESLPSSIQRTYKRVLFAEDTNDGMSKRVRDQSPQNSIVTPTQTAHLELSRCDSKWSSSAANTLSMTFKNTNKDTSPPNKPKPSVPVSTFYPSPRSSKRSSSYEIKPSPSKIPRLEDDDKTEVNTNHTSNPVTSKSKSSLKQKSPESERNPLANCSVVLDPTEIESYFLTKMKKAKPAAFRSAKRLLTQAKPVVNRNKRNATMKTLHQPRTRSSGKGGK